MRRVPKYNFGEVNCYEAVRLTMSIHVHLLPLFSTTTQLLGGLNRALLSIKRDLIILCFSLNLEARKHRLGLRFKLQLNPINCSRVILITGAMAQLQHETAGGIVIITSDDWQFPKQK